MLQVKKREIRIPTIDLTGPDGNVFFLIGTAKRWARQLKGFFDGDEIVKDMMRSDYTHAVAVFEVNFGDYCKLEMEPWLLEGISERVKILESRTSGLDKEIERLGIPGLMFPEK